LDWVFFKKRTSLFDAQPKRILHVAPEARLTDLFQSLRDVDYVSGDLDGTKAMMELDITNMPFSDNEFSVIYCSHVLEHVPDDSSALRENYRVMRQNV
jgi:predicted SAM-dependent methyltransferase